ncbi:MAG TPA: hypothetical protein PLD84_10605, partial [Chitinophagales bacterium]|nr:hypothetical protein [Chitinophagales bacterium]
MKQCFLLLTIFSLLVVSSANAQNTFPASGAAGIGTTTPNASSILEMQSTSKGLLIPRMTKAQRDAIVSPATGLQIYDLDSKLVEVYNGTSWESISASAFESVGEIITTPGNTWTKKADLAGPARTDAVGFSIGTKGYIGTGLSGGSKKDFWQFDPATNAWTQKADFGGTARLDAVGFAIGAKGYIGTGSDAGGKKKD